MTCIYCRKPGPYADEHVLTRALSGPGEDWVLENSVCVSCNNLFSRYERSWVGEPGVAMARIAFGPTGRTRKGQAFQFHPAEQMFLEVDGDPVSYEVDLLPGVEPRFRYQVIDAGEAIISVASEASDLARFAAAWGRFVKQPELTIQKRSVVAAARYRVAALDLGDVPKVVAVEWRSKPAVAWWDRFEPGIGKPAHPRMSLDPFGRIRFRTARLAQVPALLERIFAAGQISSPGRVHQPGTYHVASRSIYDVNKVHRAVAKTLVNYMTDEFGPAYVGRPEFRPILDYCLGGPDSADTGPFVGIANGWSGIPAVDHAGVDRHALALASNGLRVVGVLKLYGSSAYRVHLGPAPERTAFERAIRIDYNGVGRIAD